MRGGLAYLLATAMLCLLHPTIVMTQQPVPGGFSSADVSDKEVVAAAEAAMRSEGKAAAGSKPATLLEILRAEQQVVAGMNYKLVLRLGVDDSERDAEVVVYRNLKHGYEVTSWRWLSDSKS
jgi:hypothetical protein